MCEIDGEEIFLPDTVKRTKAGRKPLPDEAEPARWIIDDWGIEALNEAQEEVKAFCSNFRCDAPMTSTRRKFCGACRTWMTRHDGNLPGWEDCAKRRKRNKIGQRMVNEVLVDPHVMMNVF